MLPSSRLGRLRRPSQMSARGTAEPCTFEASRDSNHIIRTTRSTTEMARTANQYSAFHKIRIGLQA
jgi:hypothetical protein